MSVLLLYLSMAPSLAGQDQPGPSPPETPEARLDIMKKSLARVQLQAIDPGGESHRLRPEPSLRFTNTVGDSRDGAIFLWLGEGDRPGAAVQVFYKRDGSWIQEWTSLATGPLIAKKDGTADWRPSRGGVEFRSVPGAPRPADTAEQRLRQMHDLTRDFTANDFFRGQSWQPLRMLSKPLARYGKPGSEVTDGALFAYVLTTDPEVFLMIEARTGRDGPEWQYAFAPMSVYTLEGSCKKRVVCNLQSWPGGDPVGTFYLRGFQPGE
jgi:hypothetical protein